METEVHNQVAAPAETRTPNWNRAKQNRSSKSADGRVATVATTRREKNFVQRTDNKIHLTPTGLLMEGVYTQNHECTLPLGNFEQTKLKYSVNLDDKTEVAGRVFGFRFVLLKRLRIIDQGLRADEIFALPQTASVELFAISLSYLTHQATV